jgi:hypothetical protein
MRRKLNHYKCAVSCYDLSFEVERKLLLNFTYDDSKLRMLKESRQRSEKAITLCYELFTISKNPLWINKAFWFAERNKSFILLESVKRNFAGGLVENDSVYNQVQQLQLQYAILEKQAIEARNNTDTIALKEHQTQLAETTKNSY